MLKSLWYSFLDNYISECNCKKWQECKRCGKDYSDWKCKGCKMMIFGSKFVCIKCNIDRYGDKVAPVRQFGDWICPNCNEHLFRKRNKCRKCGTNKPKEYIFQ